MAATKKRTNSKKKPADDMVIKYANDPFFIKKRESAEKFIKKNGLPDAITRKK
jgi:hypothetical protein